MYAISPGDSVKNTKTRPGFKCGYGKAQLCLSCKFAHQFPKNKAGLAYFKVIEALKEISRHWFSCKINKSHSELKYSQSCIITNKSGVYSWNGCELNTL